MQNEFYNTFNEIWQGSRHYVVLGLLWLLGAIAFSLASFAIGRMFV